VIVSCFYLQNFHRLTRKNDVQCSLFFKGQRHGFGRFDFVEDKSDGRGKTMGYYEGEWQSGSYNGHGKIVWGSSGWSYEGEWENGEMHGRGVKKDATGTILQEGDWIRGRFQDPNRSEETALERASDGVVELD